MICTEIDWVESVEVILSWGQIISKGKMSHRASAGAFTATAASTIVTFEVKALVFHSKEQLQRKKGLLGLRSSLNTDLSMVNSIFQ